MHFSAQQTEGSFFSPGQRKERQHWLTGFEANSKRQVCFGGGRGLVGALKCQKRKTQRVESQRDNVVGSKCCFKLFGFLFFL